MRDSYAEWAERHATIFGFRGDDIAMLVAWRSLFEAADYTAAELTAATEALVRRPPNYPRDHLRDIQTVVRELRSVNRDAVAAGLGDCVKCSGTGRVIVPHPDSIKNGQWVPISTGAGPNYYTATVFCGCKLGEWFGEHGQPVGRGLPEHKKPRGMTLEDYERRNPNWKAQMAQRDEETRERLKLTPGPLSPALDAVMRRLGGSRQKQGELS